MSERGVPSSVVLAIVVVTALASGAAGGAAAAADLQSEARFIAAVALEDAGQVAIVRGPPWRLVRRVDVPAGPHNVEASPSGELFVVTSPPAGAVTLIRARTGRVVRVARVGGYPHDAVFGAQSRTLWIAAERAGQIVQIAVPSGRVLGRVRTSGPPHDLELVPGRKELWVTIDGSSRADPARRSDGRTALARSASSVMSAKGRPGLFELRGSAARQQAQSRRWRCCGWPRGADSPRERSTP